MRILSTEEFQPVGIAMQTTARRPGTERRARELEVLSDEPSIQRATLGAGDAAILRTTRNYNAGWVAELDGEELPVQRVDGWAQGWRVPAGEGGELVIRYAPETSYVVVLFTGLAVALGILVLALVLLFRTRLAPGRQPELHGAPAVAPRGWSPALLAVLALPAWLLGGVPAAVGLLLAAGFVLLGRRGPGPVARRRAARRRARRRGRLAAARPRRQPAGRRPAHRRRSPAGRRHDPDPVSARSGAVERVTGSRRDRLVDLGVSTLLALVVLGPVLLHRGFALRGDMVLVPHQPWKDAWLALDGSAPRFVPGDAVLWLLTSVVPGDLVQKALLLGALVLAGVGAGRLAADHGTAGRAAAIVLFVWNPWVFERLSIGQWGSVVGYAALPYVVLAAVRLRDDVRAGWPVLTLWLAFTALWSPASALVGALTAFCVVVVGRRARPVLATLGLAVLVNLPWLVPSLVSGDRIESPGAQFEAFAARAESAAGLVASVASLGGIWKSSVVPGRADRRARRPGLVPRHGDRDRRALAEPPRTSTRRRARPGAGWRCWRWSSSPSRSCRRSPGSPTPSTRPPSG